MSLLYFFFTDTATTEIYTLSLHDALPISVDNQGQPIQGLFFAIPSNSVKKVTDELIKSGKVRSEEHTSELQSHVNLVCRLLLEKKNKKTTRQSSLKQPEAAMNTPTPIRTM